jgi:hypothetical protein
MSNLLNNLIGPVSGILDKFVADKDLKAKLEHEINGVRVLVGFVLLHLLITSFSSPLRSLRYLSQASHTIFQSLI